MEQSKALSKPDFRHILADINWEHGSHLVLAAKRSDSQGLLLKSVPFPLGSTNVNVQSEADNLNRLSDDLSEIMQAVFPGFLLKP